MKKRLSFILAAVIMTVLLYGCAGSSTGTANDASKEKETASTESTQSPAEPETSVASAPAQDETGEAASMAQEEIDEASAPTDEEISDSAAPAKEETGEAAAPAQEGTSAASASVQDETTAAPAEEGTSAASASVQDETTAAPAETEEASDTSAGFKIMRRTMTGRSGARTDIVYYDRDGDTVCSITNDDENKAYYLQLIDKQYDENGKWISSTIYSVKEETAIDSENTDVYKTEGNIAATGTCSYDDNGFVVEMTDSFGNVAQIDTYNLQHQLLHVQSFLSGSEYFSISNTYNEQGILIEEKVTRNGETRISQYMPIGVTPYQMSSIVEGETISESELKYDENGVPVGAVYTNARTGESNEISFKLDEYGNLVGVYTKDGDTVISSIEYEIVPDE